MGRLITLKEEITMMTDQDSSIVTWAAEHAEKLLVPVENRWPHTMGVVRTAEYVGKALNDEDRSLLIAAAYLHDVGYAPQIQRTGFHPLDGAYYLLSLNQKRLASLVAYHSEAQFEAKLRDLLPELNNIPREYSAIADALTYCDIHTSPSGASIPFDERIADILQRYPEDHIVNQAIRQAIPFYTQAIANTQNLLKSQNML
jgi:hypothetical protein